MRHRLVALVSVVVFVAVMATVPGAWRLLTIGMVLIVLGIACVAIGKYPRVQRILEKPLPGGVAVGGVLVAAGISATLWSGLFLLGHNGSLVLGWQGTVAGFGSLLLISAGVTWYSVKRRREPSLWQGRVP